MADHSAIEWCDATWNPVRGCTKVSPGCAHCYAETFAERWRGIKGHPYEQGFDLRLVPEQLAIPLTWKKPRRVFVNSMSDLFQDGVPDEHIDKVFAVMALAPQHTFQVLTKRPERMRQWFEDSGRDAVTVTMQYPEFVPANGRAYPRWPAAWPLPNVWLGVSVENQHCADERIPLLLQTPAAVRFISAEPLLEAIDLTAIRRTRADGFMRPLDGRFNRIDWLIIGFESGAGARSGQLEWARSLVAQCHTAGVAAFVKQLGAHPTANYYDTPTRDHIEGRGADWPDPIGWHEHDGQPGLADRVRLTLHKKGGDMAEWPADLRVREFPEARA
jgi:protein gp37